MQIFTKYHRDSQRTIRFRCCDREFYRQQAIDHLVSAHHVRREDAKAQVEELYRELIEKMRGSQ
jgi:hypothetical protein